MFDQDRLVRLLGALHNSAELYEGYDDALIGLSFRPDNDKPVALYDKEIFITIMMEREQVTKEEAETLLVHDPDLRTKEKAIENLWDTGQPLIVGTKILWN